MNSFTKRAQELIDDLYEEHDKKMQEKEISIRGIEELLAANRKLLTYRDLERILHAMTPDASYTEDKDGQLVVHTDLQGDGLHTDKFFQSVDWEMVAGDFDEDDLDDDEAVGV